ncbi:hypothetical protein ASPCADRAFT_3175 [Aspergillus carbonarius ITEM 5010]|uniref:Uncharacterized protein n=1 Tax=Aspergillus carbonarius (strain ITEM 5010) TaxID=602072 RepID=A0A1R3RUG0_ASPC5|nr:hypothetical protein ASPCADRAFT_3175 [Aspergillus carbonarius ITEM 5010]
MTQTVLVTGANRGIGKGLITHYLSHPNTTVIGTVRDIASPAAQSLPTTLPKAPGSSLLLVPLTLDDPSSASSAASILQTQYNITHIDILIASAGICNHWGPVHEMTDSDVLSHFEINTLGPLRVYKAFASLLKNADMPKFVYISTLLASIAGVEQLASSLATAYGMSKVAGNFLVKKIEAENEWLVTLAVDPGLVQTEMGSRNAQFIGLEEAPVTVEDTVRGITAQIEAATKSTTSGQFVNFGGERVAW